MLYHPEMLVRFTGSGRPASSNEFLGSVLFEARERGRAKEIACNEANTM